MSLARKFQTAMGVAVMASVMGWQAADASAATITFTDDFERADGALGSNWTTEDPSHWAISSGAVVNQTGLPGTASGNIALPVEIAGSFSVSIDSVFPGSANAAQTTRRAEAVDFHIQEDGTRYHARYQRSSGAIQIGVWSPTAGVGNLVYAGTPNAVTASATDVIRLTVSGDNTGTGNYTITIQNLTTPKTGSATFTTSTNEGGVNPSGIPALTGGLMGFSSSNSYTAGSQQVLSFTATGEAVPEPMASALLLGGAAAASMVRPRR